MLRTSSCWLLCHRWTLVAVLLLLAGCSDSQTGALSGSSSEKAAAEKGLARGSKTQIKAAPAGSGRANTSKVVRAPGGGAPNPD